MHGLSLAIKFLSKRGDGSIQTSSDSLTRHAQLLALARPGSHKPPEGGGWVGEREKQGRGEERYLYVPLCQRVERALKKRGYIKNLVGVVICLCVYVYGR